MLLHHEVYNVFTPRDKSLYAIPYVIARLPLMRAFLGTIRCDGMCGVPIIGRALQYFVILWILFRHVTLKVLQWMVIPHSAKCVAHEMVFVHVRYNEFPSGRVYI